MLVGRTDRVEVSRAATRARTGGLTRPLSGIPAWASPPPGELLPGRGASSASSLGLYGPGDRPRGPSEDVSSRLLSEPATSTGGVS